MKKFYPFRQARKSALYKLVSAFFLISVLFLTAYYIIYRNAYETIKEGIVSSEIEGIARISQDMDNKIHDLHMLVYNLQKNASVMKLDQKGRIGYEDYATLMNLSKQYVSSNLFIDEILFYLPREINEF